MGIRFDKRVDHTDKDNYILMVKGKEVIVKSNKSLLEKFSNWFGRFVCCLPGNSYKTSKIWDAIHKMAPSEPGGKDNENPLSIEEKQVIEEWMKERLTNDQKSDYVKFFKETEICNKFYEEIDELNVRKLTGQERQNQHEEINDRITMLAGNLFPQGFVRFPPEKASVRPPPLGSYGKIDFAEDQLNHGDQIKQVMDKQFEAEWNWNRVSQDTIEFEGSLKPIESETEEQAKARAASAIKRATGLELEIKLMRPYEDEPYQISANLNDSKAIERLAKDGRAYWETERGIDWERPSVNSYSRNGSKVDPEEEIEEVEVEGERVQELQEQEDPMVKKVDIDLSQFENKASIAANYLTRKMNGYLWNEEDDGSLRFKGSLKPGQGTLEERVLEDIRLRTRRQASMAFQDLVEGPSDGWNVTGKVTDPVSISYLAALAVDDVNIGNVAKAPLFTGQQTLCCNLSDGRKILFSITEKTTVGALRAALRKIEDFERPIFSIGNTDFFETYDSVPLSRLKFEGGASIYPNLQLNIRGK